MTVPAAERPTDQPVYWFSTLEAALDEGDLEEAAAAVRELRRHGIHVRVPRSRAFPAESRVAGQPKAGGGRG